MFHSSIFPRPLNNCLHCFTLRQGSTLIAIVHLMAAAMLVHYCILALTHAVDIREMVAHDAEDAMDRGYFEDDNSMRVNMKRMKIADHNAKGKVDEMWIHLTFGLTHFGNVVLLLYGIMASNRRYLTPWLLMNALETVLIVLLLIQDEPIFDMSRCMNVCIFGPAAIISFYSVYVVWSMYVSLSRKKGLIHEIHDTSVKEKQPITECATSSSRFSTKPFEV